MNASPTTPRFQIGDRVRITCEPQPCWFRDAPATGTTATIKKLSETLFGETVYYLTGIFGPWHHDELEATS